MENRVVQARYWAWTYFLGGYIFRYGDKVDVVMRPQEIGSCGRKILTDRYVMTIKFESYLQEIDRLSALLDLCRKKRVEIDRLSKNCSEGLHEANRELFRLKIKTPEIPLVEFARRSELWIYRGSLVDRNRVVVADICKDCGGVTENGMDYLWRSLAISKINAKPPQCRCGSDMKLSNR